MNETLSHIAEPLVEWYEQNKRELPWRQDKEPYHVWISEIMLQQTRIEAVMRYYERFMQALPDVKALSEVDDDALMKLWEGLGYYSRARNLKKAAQVIVTQYGGAFPQPYDELRKLPGIGDYTAGAIASICFDERVPAVDGNVLRVIARYTGSRENVLDPLVKKNVAQRLTAVTPEKAGAFNEGLMELGERICLPNGEPDCPHCPLKENCTAYREGLTAALPVRIKKQKRTKAQYSVCLLTSPAGRIAIEKRPGSGLLAGLYQLPNIEGFHADEALLSVLSDWGLEPLAFTVLGEKKHVFTHIDWYMKGYAVTVAKESACFLWVTPQELKETYSLPTAFQKIYRLHENL